MERKFHTRNFGSGCVTADNITRFIYVQIKNRNSMKNALYILAILTMGCQGSGKNGVVINEKTPLVDSVAIPNINSSFLLKHPLLTWMRKNPVEIGCMFETE